MPHHRKRYIYSKLVKDLSWSPIVSLVGMRQSGKTTLLRELSKDYLSLDEDQVLNDFLEANWSRLDVLKSPIGIDECQKVPKLFDRVKFLVDKKKTPGQFILTGSVRFLSKSQIRESLTGRTSVLELLPMILSETLEIPMSSFLKCILETNSSELQKKIEKIPARSSDKNILNFLLKGGMPGIAFKRDVSIQNRQWNLHLQTLLSRDIKLLLNTRLSLSRLLSLFRELVMNQGNPTNHSSLARLVGISVPSVGKLLHAMEGLFLIRSVGDTYYCEDQGLASHVLGYNNTSDSLSEVEIFHLRRLVFQELFAQISYGPGLDSDVQLKNYRTRGGIDIPFLIESKASPIAICVDNEDLPSEKSLKTLTWFKKKKPTAKTFILYTGKEVIETHSNHLCIPIDKIF